jgi:hypothetical protein
MVESRWIRRVIPVLAAVTAVTAVAAVATTSLGARDRPWDPPPCPGKTLGVSNVPGTWWRLDPRLADGRLIGQRLAVGGPGVGRPRHLDLPVESFAAGPFRGQVLVGSDDGVRSTLTMIDVARGCATVVGASTDVIRRATLTPERTAIVEFRVARGSRTERGVFERALSGRRTVARLLAPIGADARFGPTWTTELAWSTDGRWLAVQSCGAVACRTRVLDRLDGSVDLIADLEHGDMVGLADSRLVVHGACGGLPCSLLSVDLAGGATVTLHRAAGLAALVMGPTGRPTVVHEVGAGGGALRSVGVDGSDAAIVPADPLGRRVLDGPARAGGAAESGPGLVVLGPEGRLPIDGPAVAILRRLADGASLRFDEVSR